MTQTLQNNDQLIDMNDLFNEHDNYPYGETDTPEYTQEPEENDSIVEQQIEVVPATVELVNNTPTEEKKKRGRRKVIKPEIGNNSQTTTEVSQVVKEEPINKSWAISLSLIPEDGLEVNEFGARTYRYERIRVKNVDTPYFVCIAKNHSDEWNKSNVIAPLSERYCVVQLEKYFEELSKKTTFIGEPSVLTDTFSPYYMAVSANMSVDVVKVFDDNSTKTIFGMLTGSKVDVLNNLDVQLSVMLNNTYNGTRSLRQDFVLSFASMVEDKKVFFKDFFSMVNMSKVIEHTGSVEDIDTPDNIIEKIKNSIDVLKSIEDVDGLTSVITDKLSTEAKEMFNGIWSGCVGDFNNMYYMLLCLSITLTRHFNLRNYSNLRSTVDRMIKKYTMGK